MEEISLNGGTTGLFEIVDLRLRFDAFGDEIEAEAACDGNDCQDYRKMAVLAPDFLDEGLVDLQRVNGKSMQVGERGITRAEVVDGDADSKLAEIIELRDRMQRVADADVFGDFHLDLGWRDAIVTQGRLELFCKIAAIEVLR